MVSEANMEALMRLNASRAGHDKLVRSAQYACRSPLNDESFYREKSFPLYLSEQNILRKLIINHSLSLWNVFHFRISLFS